MELLDGVQLTPLKRISHEKGDILHALKLSEASYAGFGEVYFSIVHCGDVKAWKCHQEMVLNLVVPMGTVKFVVMDLDKPGKLFETTLSKDFYARLTIAPGLWFGFQGIDKGINLICSITNQEHDPAEVDRKELHEIAYEW